MRQRRPLASKNSPDPTQPASLIDGKSTDAVIDGIEPRCVKSSVVKWGVNCLDRCSIRREVIGTFPVVKALRCKDEAV